MEHPTLNKNECQIVWRTRADLVRILSGSVPRSRWGLVMLRATMELTEQTLEFAAEVEAPPPEAPPPALPALCNNSTYAWRDGRPVQVLHCRLSDEHLGDCLFEDPT